MSVLQQSGTRPIHVGFVVTRFEMGGMERCIARVANGLDSDRFTASIICLDKNGSASTWLERQDVKVFELHKGRGNSLAVVPRLSRLCREQAIDVLHSHNWGTLLETSLAKAYSKSSFAHIHAERGTVLGSQVARGMKLKLRRTIMKWASSRADLLTTNSSVVAAKIESITGIRRDSVCLIPNGVNLPSTYHESYLRRDSLRAEFGLSRDTILVGTIGRLVSVKNFGLAINGLDAVRHRTGRDFRLMIVGDGPEMPKLKALATSLNLESVIYFLGKQDNVWKYLAAMDIYVNTSLSEGMSQSILEAMAAGLPVVATNVGDAEKMLCGPTPAGIIFPSGNATAMADSLVNVSLAEDTRLSFATNARQRHQSLYSEEAMIRGFASMYERAIANKMRSGGRVSQRPGPG